MSNIVGHLGNLAMANEVEGAVVTVVLEDGAALEILIIAMTINIEGEVEVKEEGISQITDKEVKIISLTVDADNGMVMTQLTVTEIIGIEILMVIIMEIEVGDGMAIEGKVIVIEDGEDDGIQIPNTHNRITHNTIQTKTTISPLLWDANINTNCLMSNTPPYPQPQQQYSQRPPAQSRQAANICQLCQNQGHYDYQCQFAGDFMARTQKAFNQGHSYNHQDPNQGEWSNGDNNNDDPNGQPFQ